MTRKSSWRPITAYVRSIQFDGDRVLRCKKCGANHIMCKPSYPTMPRAQYQWVQAFNTEIGNFFCQHERCQ